MKRQFARRLRKSATDAEVRVWSRLRNRNLEGFKFKRQEPIGHYIVDFVCHETKLIIELDGGQHTEPNAYDDRRTGFLIQNGYTVIRFWNNDVLQNTESILESVRLALSPSWERDATP